MKIEKIITKSILLFLLFKINKMKKGIKRIFSEIDQDNQKLESQQKVPKIID